MTKTPCTKCVYLEREFFRKVSGEIESRPTGQCMAWDNSWLSEQALNDTHPVECDRFEHRNPRERETTDGADS